MMQLIPIQHQISRISVVPSGGARVTQNIQLSLTRIPSTHRLTMEELRIHMFNTQLLQNFPFNNNLYAMLSSFPNLTTLTLH